MADNQAIGRVSIPIAYAKRNLLEKTMAAQRTNMLTPHRQLRRTIGRVTVFVACTIVPAGLLAFGLPLTQKMRAKSRAAFAQSSLGDAGELAA